MSSTQRPTDGSEPDHPAHRRDELGHEGMYQDSDVTDTPPDEPVGEYADTDVAEPPSTHPHDEGSFADHDVVSEHRHPAAEGSFEDADLPDEDVDVEAVQVERAHHAHGEADDIHTARSDPADPPADPT